jgi:selenocysteine-specific elongation factor
MPYIIGTAGHIDHGKTSLIKALTGQDTDRLKEEKERGISIDLGFAHLDLPDGTQAGIVDVPGHERFIRNMLAGAHAMDLVLFTVAADDGVMPQTEEHLDILHLLGIKLAIFVVTKIDLVSPARARETEEEIRILTLGTTLERAPIVAFSAATGQGLEELKRRIYDQLRDYRKIEPSGYFRLPIDRVFLLQGHGTVVTGTALSGKLEAGARVRLLPGDHLSRVRSIQVHNRPVPSAKWGQRVAINLSGQEKVSIRRGDVLCDEKISATTDRFDAWLETRSAAGIKNHQRLRIYAGTAERLAKVILLGDAESLSPKESGYCQVTLAEPVAALRGDRFIVRDETARRTLAGGVILHPWAKRHKRREGALLATLESLRSDDVQRQTLAFIDGGEEFAPPIGLLYQFLNLKEDEASAALDKMDSIRTFSVEGEKDYTTREKWRSFQEAVVTLLERFHAAHPLAPGMDMEEIRAKLPYRIPAKLFRVLIDSLHAEAVIIREASHVRLPTHEVEIGEAEKKIMAAILHALAANPAAPPDSKQLEKDMAIDRAKLNTILQLMERRRSIVRVATDLYFAADYVDSARALLYKCVGEKGEITAAYFRDLLGSSRKYTIALLEHFDHDGTTVRIGDARRLRSAPQRKREANGAD